MRPTVLVVEDFEILRDQLDEILTSAGYRVRLAKTLREALNKSQQERFDAVLLDVTCIPQSSNSKIEFEENIPLLLTRTKSQNEVADAIARDHAVSCINKPFKEREVLEKLANALQKTETAHDPVVKSFSFSTASPENEPTTELTNPSEIGRGPNSQNSRVDIASLHLAFDTASEARAAYVKCSQARERNSRISCDDEWRLLEEARQGLQLVLDAHIDSRISLAASEAEVSSPPLIEDITVSPDISDEQVPAWPNPNVSRGIDLEAEVCRYEIELIKRTLKITSGHQSRAAGLLRMNPTTLNSKNQKVSHPDRLILFEGANVNLT